MGDRGVSRTDEAPIGGPVDRGMTSRTEEGSRVFARIWRARVERDRVNEYERFAEEQSLPMFRERAGFLGVLFARDERNCAVITLWEDLAAVAALETSARYREAVARITEMGLFIGDQSVEILHVRGGVLRRPWPQVSSGMEPAFAED
jgi:heme-degrading monooxygenase HmoA